MPSSPEAASAAPGEIETPLSPDTASAAPDTASAASGVVVKLTGDPPTAADHALEARHEAKHEAKISDAAYRAVLTKKLVLRTGLSLSSAKIGDLPAGKEIIIINRQQTEDGVERVRVGQDSSPRGIAVHNLGWVTALKDGERKLTTVLERGGSPRHHVRGFIEGMDNLGDSVAQRIALRRRKRLHARGALPRTHTAEGSHAVASMMLSGGNYTRTSRGGGAVREANVPVPHQKLDAWVPVEMLVKHRATLLQTANLERQRDPEAPPAIKLARLFEWKQLTVTQLMREWDTNNDVRWASARLDEHCALLSAHTPIAAELSHTVAPHRHRRHSFLVRSRDAHVCTIERALLRSQGFVSQAEFCRGVRTAGLSEDEFSSTSLKAIFSVRANSPRCSYSFYQHPTHRDPVNDFCAAARIPCNLHTAWPLVYTLTVCPLEHSRLMSIITTRWIRRSWLQRCDACKSRCHWWTRGRSTQRLGSTTCKR